MKLKPLFVVFVFGWCCAQWFANANEPWGNPPWQPLGEYVHEPIRESSGVVLSRQFGNVYWTLNDSGNPPVLYATRMDGELIQEFPVQDANNRDWEALAIDDNGQLWVGEIGNNSRMRDDLTVIVVPEPDPFRDSEAKAIAQYPYRYPDENVDAEGMFIIDGFPYIVSKEPERAVLYRFTDLDPDNIHVLSQVGELADAAVVTGADLSTNGKRLAVCTYDALWVYSGEPNDIVNLIRRRPWKVEHTFAGEAIVFDGDDLILTNEQRDIFRVPAWWYERELPMPPRNTQSASSRLAQTRVQGGKLRVESYIEAGLEIGGGHLVLDTLRPRAATISQIIEVPYADRYLINALLTRGPEYGQVALVLDGKSTGPLVDCYDANLIIGSVTPLGSLPLKAGQNEVTLQVTGKSSNSTGYKVGLDSYLIRSDARFATQYMVLGPFPKADPWNIDAPLPPENGLDLNGTFTGLEGQEILWKRGEADADGKLDLLKTISQIENAVGYALTYVHSESDHDAVLLVGSDDEIAIWLNGEEIHRHNVGRGARADDDAVPCHLNRGWNTVLSKIGQGKGGWGLYLRFTDMDSSLMYGIQPGE